MARSPRRQFGNRAAPPQPAISAAPARAKRPRKEPTEFYVVEIADWDWSFSFAANFSRALPGPFIDARLLKINGPLLRPNMAGIKMAELILLPDPRLNHNQLRCVPRPPEIAQLHIQSGKLYGIVAIPADVLSSVMTALTCGRLKYVVLEGGPLFRRQASIRGFRIASSFDETHLPPERVHHQRGETRAGH
jgi:hypothetical protein